MQGFVSSAGSYTTPPKGSDYKNESGCRAAGLFDRGRGWRAHKQAERRGKQRTGWSLYLTLSVALRCGHVICASESNYRETSENNIFYFVNSLPQSVAL